MPNILVSKKQRERELRARLEQADVLRESIAWEAEAKLEKACPTPR